MCMVENPASYQTGAVSLPHCQQRQKQVSILFLLIGPLLWCSVWLQVGVALVSPWHSLDPEQNQALVCSFGMRKGGE